MRKHDVEDFSESLDRHVRVRVALEVRDRLRIRAAARDAFEAELELPDKLVAALQRSRARALDVAVDATAAALRAVAVRTTRAGVERDAMDRRAERLLQPRSERA